MNLSKSELEELLSRAGNRSFDSTLFNIAHSYARAGEMAASSIFSLNDADFAAPAIMCKSFAIELLLKFFMVVTHPGVRSYADLKMLGVDLRGHTFSQLFDKIGAEFQHRIASTFSVASNRTVNEAGFRAILIEIGDDSFVHWRYIYEKNGFHHFDGTLFDTVLNALGKAAEAERQRVAQNTP